MPCVKPPNCSTGSRGTHPKRAPRPNTPWCALTQGAHISSDATTIAAGPTSACVRRRSALPVLAPDLGRSGARLHRDCARPAGLWTHGQAPRGLRQAHDGYRCVGTGSRAGVFDGRRRRARPRRPGRAPVCWSCGAVKDCSQPYRRWRSGKTTRTRSPDPRFPNAATSSRRSNRWSSWSGSVHSSPEGGRTQRYYGLAVDPTAAARFARARSRARSSSVSADRR